GIGTHTDRIITAVEEIGLELNDIEVIAPTHVHLDHAGGAGFLADSCPNSTVYVHEIGAPHLIDPEQLIKGTKRAVQDQWKYYTKPKPIPETRITEIADGHTIDLGNRTLEVHYAPGHAPHQVVFFDTLDNAVFTADAAGIWVPRLGQVRETTPPPNFDLEQCLDDVDMIESLDPDVLLYPHFGPAPETISLLEEYKTVLRSWVEDIKTAKEELGDDTAVVEKFTEQTAVDSVWGPEKARSETAMNVRGVLQYLQER
ncbi:MAG: MBL fold metallo-hydrolase, partial [Halobacteriaceae archaeon]